VDHQHVLVDQVAPHQGLDQLSTAQDHQILLHARLILEPGHGIGGVALEER
jgi:hypothetical protein